MVEPSPIRTATSALRRSDGFLTPFDSTRYFTAARIRECLSIISCWVIEFSSLAKVLITYFSLMESALSTVDLPSWVEICRSGRQLPKEFLLTKTRELILKKFGEGKLTDTLVNGWSKHPADKLQEFVVEMCGYAG